MRSCGCTAGRRPARGGGRVDRGACDWGGVAAEALAARWAAVVGAPAYALWARGSSSRPDEVLAALRGFPPERDGTVPEGLPADVRGVLAAFVDGRRHLADLSDRLALALRISEASDEALALLPSGTPLPAMVYVLVSGHRG